MADVLQGSCLCGAVQYEVTGPIHHASHCHCGMCRKAHGAAFASYASVAREHHHFTAGQAALKVYNSSTNVQRWFCGHCGSPLLWVQTDQPLGLVAFSLGTLDTPLPSVRIKHIYADSKAQWWHVPAA